ncbi:MAG: XRE family transcriptional regulator [Actinomycetota bacterium]
MVSEVATIARAVRQRRAEFGWTLDEAAERLGISRRLLVQLEQSDANPSLTTLLRVAEGFGVGLSDLLSDDTTPAGVVGHHRDAHAFWTSASGSSARLVVSLGDHEVWRWLLSPGDHYLSDPHRAGTVESVTVVRGRLVVAVDGADALVVRSGASALYATDAAHEYRNEGTSVTEFVMHTYEPSRPLHPITTAR